MQTSQQAQKLKDTHDSHFADSERLMQFLQNSTSHISEFLSGVLVSEQKDWKLSVGHLVRAFIKDKSLAQLGAEIKKNKDEGIIKADFLENDVNRSCFKEILEFVDDESPDEVRFAAMKSILFSSLEIGIEAKNELIAHELMKICRELSFAEVMIMKANLAYLAEGSETAVIGRDIHNHEVKHWATSVAALSGHSLPEIVLSYEPHLVDLHLISERTFELDEAAGTHFVPTHHFRLTPLGYLFCEYATRYQ